jgi:hypothetical protein
LLFVLIALGGHCILKADDEGGGKPEGPEKIHQKEPAFLVRADVDRATRLYRQGDLLTVQAASEADAYVYVLYKQADGKVFQIFPNSSQPDNLVKARQAVQIPAKDDLFRWVIGPPFGKEYIKVIASKEKLSELSDPAMRQGQFNPVSSTQVKGIELELGKEEPPAWAEDCVEIETHARNDAAKPSGTHRYGVFIGIGDYAFLSKTVHTADGKEEKVGLPCHRDARLLANVFREAGQLDDVRIRTNDEATRKDIEEAITQWLPSVSRPGDTVFIYFSGMAIYVPGGEDDLGSALAAHDFMSLSTYEELAEMKRQGKLPDDLAPPFAEASRIVKQAGTKEQAAMSLIQAKAITNTVFAHWLQMLAGRQIVVILDSGFAFSFVPVSNAGPAATGFGRNVSRLKDLGQIEIALLGGSGISVSEVARDPERLSLMTGWLIKCLTSLSGPITLEQAHKYITDHQNDGKTQLPEPCLVNLCTKPVVLKP